MNNSNNNIEVVLGFDARNASDQYISTVWSATRRQEWLLRPDVSQPLSVDSDVWPSVTSYQQILGEQAWIGFIQDLWEDLGKLLQFVKTQKPQVAYEIAGFSLVREDFSSADDILWAEILLETFPDRFDSTWTSMGYDVADRFLSSALMNCFHSSQADFPAIQSRFGRRVNANHLFDLPNDAQEFRTVANESVPEHAPFYVYRIYRGK